MNPDATFLHDIWDSVKPFVPVKEHEEAAEAIIRVFDENIDISALEDSVNEFDGVFRDALIVYLDLDLEDYDEFGEDD